MDFVDDVIAMGNRSILAGSRRAYMRDRIDHYHIRNIYRILDEV